ncbi:hypothetical protein MC885_011729 [Smutsia gigantea]|nr:hypothetical protein MC885_011729 [Smutsia gigantea]
MLEQLRQVNGIDPHRDSAEFDLLFENAFDQWVASTASEKCTFFQILHHTCQRYLPDRKPEFINCQSKVMGGSLTLLNSNKDILVAKAFDDEDIVDHLILFKITVFLDISLPASSENDPNALLVNNLVMVLLRDRQFPFQL